MKSRAGRLSLLVMFVVALGVTAYLFWSSNKSASAEREAQAAFQSGTRTAARGVLTLRAAQQAYVATGQSGDFWAPKVTDALTRTRDVIAALRSSAASPVAQSELDTAGGSLQDFVQMDTRAREYERTGQNLLAADLIFSNGIEITDAALAALDRADAAEAQARDGSRATLERRARFALIAAGAAACLIILLLLPRVEVETVVPSFAAPREQLAPSVMEPASIALSEPVELNEAEGWSPPKRVAPAAPKSVEPAATPAPEPAVTEPDPQVAAVSPAPAQVAAPVHAPAPVVPALNFSAVAVLCTELSRVDDTMALPPLLQRASAILDAVGIILWIADPDGRELNPVLAHGYPQNLINRLGTIPRDAENATAAAYRTGLLQTVYAEGASSGAIAAPLVTCGGCVGVMAAEVLHDGEKQDARLAAATIVAAQLASLVGPPAARGSDSRVGVAGA